MKKYLLIAAIAAFSSASVMADDAFGTSDDSGGGTLYGGVSLGKTDADCGSVDCKSSNWKLLAGYDVTSNIAVEGAYHNLYKKDNVKATGISGAGLYKMPVSDDIEAFGKAGFMAWEASNATSGGTADGTDVLLGAGATYKIDDNWGIRGEYEHVGGDLKANMYSLGATFSTF